MSPVVTAYVVEVRSSVMREPWVYRLTVFFGLVVGRPESLTSLVMLCAYSFDEFVKLCAELGWIVRRCEDDCVQV